MKVNASLKKKKEKGKFYMSDNSQMPRNKTMNEYIQFCCWI